MIKNTSNYDWRQKNLFTISIMNIDSHQREIQDNEFLKNWIKQQLVSSLNFESMPLGIALPLSDALIEVGVGIRNYLRQRQQ